MRQIRIAIIEDTKTMAAIIAKFLEEDKYSYDVFNSKPKEIKRLCHFTPDYILCRSEPKYQSFTEVVASVNLRKELRLAKIIVMTSSTSTMEKRGLDSELFDCILPTPFTQQKLLSCLEQFNTRKQLIERSIPLVVIVDDSKSVRAVLTSEMKQLGFQVKVASDGKEGLELITKELPDLTILDIHMPVLDGLMVCKKLTSNPKTSNLPVIIFSSDLNEGVLRKGFNSGVIDFLSKPVDSAELADTVSSVMGRNKKMQRKTRALVLESNMSAAMVICKLLADLGVVTDICSTVKDFTDHLAVTIPDLISLDLDLAAEKGRLLVRELRRNQKFKQTPIVIVSAAHKRDAMIDCLKEGANDFLEKPFVREEFLVRIQNLLRIKKLQDENCENNRLLEEMAYHDKLTQLFNRQYFDMRLKKECERSKVKENPFSLIFMELDDFEEINDLFGPSMEDKLLKEVSGVIKKSVRLFDVVCRYGSSKFCIILPKTNLSEAVKVAEQIRINCGAKQYTVEQFNQTVSAGVSCYPTHSKEHNIFLDADSALYQAKKLKNKVSMFNVI